MSDNGEDEQRPAVCAANGHDRRCRRCGNGLKCRFGRPPLHQGAAGRLRRSRSAHASTAIAAFIRTALANREGLVVDLFFQEAMVIALPRKHPLAGRAGAALPLKALADKIFIVYRRHTGPGLHDAILAACSDRRNPAYDL
jgi:hypothetical protein